MLPLVCPCPPNESCWSPGKEAEEEEAACQVEKAEVQLAMCCVVGPVGPHHVVLGVWALCQGHPVPPWHPATLPPWYTDTEELSAVHCCVSCYVRSEGAPYEHGM